jgi:Mrp family chromosome partitioning ATPase
MKHSRISLLERAADVYDFGAALRARAPAPAPAQAEPAPVLVEPAPARAEPRSPIIHAEIEAPEAVLELGLAERADIEVEAEIAPHRAPNGAAVVDRVALAEAGHIVPEAPATGLAEEFRLIKRRLLANMERLGTLPEEKRRSVLVCSAQPKEGKTFCAVNLALSLAGEREVEVLLVDGDFTKPDVLSTLGISTGPGLVDALADPAADPEDFVIRTDVAGLSVLPAGRKLNNVPELLASGRTREVLARLIAGDRRRIILFDSPPALMASPATLLAGLVGQALVVVRADQTTEADLRETIGLLSGCDHVALMLNGAAVAVSGRKYGAYDGYGHGE